MELAFCQELVALLMDQKVARVVLLTGLDSSVRSDKELRRSMAGVGYYRTPSASAATAFTTEVARLQRQRWQELKPSSEFPACPTGMVDARGDPVGGEWDSPASERQELPVRAEGWRIAYVQ